MTEFWDKPAEKSGKVLAAFLEGLPLIKTLKIHHRRGDGAYKGPGYWIYI
jgi:hypothetical protein